MSMSSDSKAVDASLPEVQLEMGDRVAEVRAVQSLPFEVEFSGPAMVSEYFTVTENDNASDLVFHDEAKSGKQLRSSFRGRKLLGAKVDVPDGYVGLVMEPEKGVPTKEAVHEKLIATGSFSGITYWNRETPPSVGDRIPQAWEALAILKVANKTVALNRIDAILNPKTATKESQLKKRPREEDGDGLPEAKRKKMKDDEERDEEKDK